MIAALISITTFLAVFLGIFAVNLVITDMFKRRQKTLMEEMESELRDRIRLRASADAKDDMELLNQLSKETQGMSYFSIVDLWKKLKDIAEESGTGVAIPTLFGVAGLLAVAAFGIGFLLTRSYIVGGAAAAIVVWLPFFWLIRKRIKRQDTLRSQLPDALDLMSRVIRAGQTITQAMQVVAEEYAAPISHEFAYCYEQQRLGLAQEVAMKQLAKRSGLLELRIFVLGVQIHRTTGGNLVELLELLSKMIRQRFHILGEIKALTAEGRMQAAILMILPFAVWMVLFFINNSYAMSLFDHPSLVVTMMILMVIGWLWIRRIVNFQF